MINSAWGPEPVGDVLRRRGHRILKTGDPRQTLLPLDRNVPLSGDEFNRFLELFGKTSFRKFCRRLTSAGGAPVVLSSVVGIAGDEIDGYVSFLESLGVVGRVEGSVMLTRKVDNIGPTLEWYIAEVCKRELAGSAEWSVHLDELPVGGDCDVLAWLPPALLYVEAKSTRPADVSSNELAHFLQRNQEVAPDLAVLLIDTDEDLSEVAARLGAVVHGQPYRAQEGVLHYYDFAPLPDLPEVRYDYEQQAYLINSKPSVITQLRRCLRHHARRAKWPGTLRRNFVTRQDEEW